MTQTKPTIVLVHGAWADGSSWTNVHQAAAGRRPRRRHAAEHACAASRPMRPSSGATSTRSTARWCSSRIRTVASSSRTPRRARSNVKALVYVDAFIPDEGQHAAPSRRQESVLTPALTNPTRSSSSCRSPGRRRRLDTYLLPDVVAEQLRERRVGGGGESDPCDAAPASLAGLPSRPGRRPGRTSRRGRSSAPRTGSFRRTPSARWPTCGRHGDARSTPRTCRWCPSPQSWSR